MDLSLGLDREFLKGWFKSKDRGAGELIWRGKEELWEIGDRFRILGTFLKFLIYLPHWVEKSSSSLETLKVYSKSVEWMEILEGCTAGFIKIRILQFEQGSSKNLHPKNVPKKLPIFWKTSNIFRLSRRAPIENQIAFLDQMTFSSSKVWW